MPAHAMAAPPAREATATLCRESWQRLERRMLIDGRLVDGENGQTLLSVNPANGRVIGRAPDGTVADARRAITAARRAFDDGEWSTNIGLRIGCLEQLYRALVEHREQLRELTIAEVGATRSSTEGPHLDAPVGLIRDYADLLKTYPMTEDIGSIDRCGQRHHRWVEKEAAGVVGAITASTYPTQLALARLGPALAAGCTVVLKAAPDTSLITLALGELIAVCTDIPPGVVNVLSALDPAVDTVLTNSPDVDVVTFAGPAAGGRRIMAAASNTVKRILLESGGTSAAIVLDDADFPACAEWAVVMATTHAGQGFSLTSRLLVPRRHHDEIVRLLAQRFDAVRYGDPADPATQMGPLISDKLRDEVHGMVKRAVAAGATVVVGGSMVRPGYFYEPTLVTNVGVDSQIARDHVSGPVLIVIAYDDDDHAIRIANTWTKDLPGAVFGSHDRAVRVARRVRSSTLSVNGGNDPHAAGVAALEEFLERKTFAAVIV